MSGSDLTRDQAVIVKTFNDPEEFTLQVEISSCDHRSFHGSCLENRQVLKYIRGLIGTSRSGGSAEGGLDDLIGFWETDGEFPALFYIPVSTMSGSADKAKIIPKAQWRSHVFGCQVIGIAFYRPYDHQGGYCKDTVPQIFRYIQGPQVFCSQRFHG